jgi:adenine-specific DNA-methyltransferase
MARARKAETYKHKDEALLRPDVGTQAQFRKKKPPRTYRYDSSLSPALDWDGTNSARELGEWLIAQIDEASRLDPPHRFPEPRHFGGVEIVGLADAVERLKALSRPFLDWTGKAERLSFDVPTLPLFVHERLSTKAILQTLAGHERDRQMELQLFADPQLPLHQQLEAYEHKGDWVNRMILGDSLVVMNSLLEYEGLGGQVQMNGVRLILETKGHDVLEEIKTQAALRWVDAVNADGSHGEWRYEIVHDMDAFRGVIDRVAAFHP